MSDENLRESRVTVTDIDISFGRLILIFIKFGLAAIPAAIIVSLIFALVMTFLGGLFGGMMPGTMHGLR